METGKTGAVSMRKTSSWNKQVSKQKDSNQEEMEKEKSEQRK